ncbi:NAD(P)-binding protein [Aureobasidium pullulans]|uniref:NAD(P)-binding protein n=1 Tax=Aureobasidium pullulans TaxID=5580 RepID=A0A4S9A3P8_AURPU|nr:NAD(P)-binding protein [Aureobasidium pullulans]
MSPIRIGLIGLSTNSQGTSWASAAHLPYLLSEQGKAHYEIKALCNSSVESAKKSIEHYKLPGEVKAYDSAQDLANDKDIDLVVCVVGVERHYELLKPAVEAGKNIYTELPLASNLDQIRELVSLAEKKGSKTMFGSQGQASPVVKVIKKLIADGKLGKVLSTSLKGNSGIAGGDAVPTGYKYIVVRKAGGNSATIFFLHSFNCLLETFGELEAFSSVMGIERPRMNLIDLKQNGKVVETIDKDTPDNIMLQGRFKSGALVNYELRSAAQFPGEPGVRWTIHGDKGEILVTCPSGMFDINHEGVKIQFHDMSKDSAETIDLPSDSLADLKHPAQNVGRLYEAYAKGESDSYCDWKLALRRHELIEEMFQRGDGSKPFGEKASYVTKDGSSSGSSSGASSGSIQGSQAEVDADAQGSILADREVKPKEITREAGSGNTQTTVEALEAEGFGASSGKNDLSKNGGNRDLAS